MEAQSNGRAAVNLGSIRARLCPGRRGRAAIRSRSLLTENVFSFQHRTRTSVEETDMPLHKIAPAIGMTVYVTLLATLLIG